MHNFTPVEKIIILAKKFYPDLDTLGFITGVEIKDYTLDTVLDSILLDGLKTATVPNALDTGICGFVDIYISGIKTELLDLCNSKAIHLYHDYGEILPSITRSIKIRSKELYSTWPKFSGNFSYPVPSPKGDVHPSKVYWSDTPKWTGEYGDLRKELLDHSIKLLESNLFINYMINPGLQQNHNLVRFLNR
ncbi:hypothetical protein TH1_137 [Shewanella phage Thanatos-1]|nr:hypothetical protein TH1_137 [Shewanella phage Thanatos-1]